MATLRTRPRLSLVGDVPASSREVYRAGGVTFDGQTGEILDSQTYEPLVDPISGAPLLLPEATVAILLAGGTADTSEAQAAQSTGVPASQGPAPAASLLKNPLALAGAGLAGLWLFSRLW